MIRLRDVTFLVHDHDEALTFFVDALGFAVRQDETFDGGWRRVVVGPPDGAWDLIEPPTRWSEPTVASS